MSFNCYKPLRLIELFAGIGSQAKALKNLGVEFQHWYVCEWDKYAIQSYNAVHDTNFDTSDITKLTANDLNIVDTEHFNYLLTYSFPCQDLSNAGKGAGMEKGSGTRSGLLWEVERLLDECTELPQILLMENVPQVHGKKNINDFNKWIEFLESKGYSNYWKDLNAKDYGIPQSRNRCYMVSVLGDYKYEFPTPIPLNLTLGDMLEKEVDEKYYLSERALNGCAKTEFSSHKLENRMAKNGIMPTLLSRDYKDPKLVAEKSELKAKLCNELLEKGLVEEHDVIRHSYTNNRLNNGDKNMGRTQNKDKLSPTLDTRCDCLGVVVKEPTELQKEVCNKAMEQGLMKPYDIIDYTYSNARLGEILDGHIKTKNSTDNQIANTITTNADCFGVCVPDETMNKYYLSDRMKKYINSYDDKYVVSDTNLVINPPIAKTITTREGNSRADSCSYISPDLPQNQNVANMDLIPLRIRKLTPKECWRLMGFTDEDVERAGKVCSNSKLYKQAGNSIVVDVLMAIFKELFIPKKTRSEWLDELLGGL